MQATSTPYQTHFEHPLKLKDWLGKEVGLTDWYTMTQEEVNTFAQVTGDLQWIHTNPKRSAKESPYGKTIAHGFLMLSLVSKLAKAAYQIDQVKMGINYGLERVRFPNATPVGAHYRARVRLQDVQAKDQSVRFITEVTIELEGEAKPACVAECIVLVYY